MACFDETLDRRGGSGGAGAVGIFPYRCWSGEWGHDLEACNLGVQLFPRTYQKK